MVQAQLQIALVICIPLITLCSAWDVKVVMTLTFVQFALFFLTFWWELARWLDSWLLDVLYNSDTHSSWNLAGIQNTQDDVIINLVMRLMFLVLLDIPIVWGAVLTTVFVSIMLFTNSYKKIERSIIAFVSVIGLSFIYELFLVDIDWPMAVEGWVTPAIPKGSMLIIMSVLGAVVMPHNLFLHSEVIQSHEYNKQDTASIKKVLKYELFDTLFSMIIGWAINSAMILLAAATFFKSGIQVEELQQAKSLLEPLLGSNAAIVFALALLMAGISSTITSGMAAGSIFAGIFGESYHIKDSHSQVGVILSLGIALLLIFFIGDPFKGLIISQMVLSIQLPFTVFLQVGLTSSRKVMGDYVNSKWSTFVLYTIAVIVTVLNIMLLFS